MRPIRRAVVALGSNLGERLPSLQGAINALADTPDVWLTEVSPVYETEPVDAPDGSENYLNAVVLLDTTLAASRLLDPAHAIEDAFGPDPSAGVVNAPRPLDVDVIVVGDRRRNDEVMQLPHPRAAERAFVLQPWYDVEPDAEIPDAGAAADLPEKSDRSALPQRDDPRPQGRLPRLHERPEQPVSGEPEPPDDFPEPSEQPTGRL